jgi:hypothetical protein
LKEPVNEASELYAKYPSGNERGALCLVINEKTIYQWKFQTDTTTTPAPVVGIWEALVMGITEADVIEIVNEMLEGYLTGVDLSEDGEDWTPVPVIDGIAKIDLSNVGKVKDVMVTTDGEDYESVVDSEKVARIDLSEVGQVKDVHYDGESIVDPITKIANVPKELPPFTEADAGKVLTISETGQLEWAEMSNRLTVLDASTGNYVEIQIWRGTYTQYQQLIADDNLLADTLYLVTDFQTIQYQQS